MSDWYEKAYEEFLKELVDDTGMGKASIQLVLSKLDDIGLLDYDIEKEVLYERYVEDE